MKSLNYFFLAALLAVLLSVGSVVNAQHAGDLLVGRTQQGKLRIAGFEVTQTIVPLLPVSGLLRGWTDTDPGFDRVIDADPGRNLYPLSPGAQIWLEIVVVDPAFRVIDNSLQPLQQPGQRTLLGNDTLHTHVTWHINSADPRFDPDKCVWEATFLLRDLGMTRYAVSDPFTMRFTNVTLHEADGDFDQDGDVDWRDFAFFVDCLAGVGGPPNPEETCALKCEITFDFDGDDDVDLEDGAPFQMAFTGD